MTLKEFRDKWLAANVHRNTNRFAAWLGYSPQLVHHWIVGHPSGRPIRPRFETIQDIHTKTRGRVKLEDWA